MNHSRGFGVLTDAFGREISSTETYTCAHCNIVGVVKNDTAVCKKCMRRVCTRKDCNLHCVPFEKKEELLGKIRKVEERDALLRSMGFR